MPLRLVVGFGEESPVGQVRFTPRKVKRLTLQKNPPAGYAPVWPIKANMVRHLREPQRCFQSVCVGATINAERCSGVRLRSSDHI